MRNTKKVRRKSEVDKAAQRKLFHKKRHERLHKALDELAADYLRHNMGYFSGKTLGTTSIMELIEWSYKQVINPDELPTE